MQVLTIESVGPSKSGKALRVKAGNTWYGAKKDSGLSAGMIIEAQVSDGSFGPWIDKWKVSNGSAAPQQGGAPLSGHTGSGNGPATGGAVGAAPIWANFVSNQVAHAIQAGLITDPSHIKLWAAAAKQAFVELA